METLKTALNWIVQLETAPAGLLTFIVCIALGYILKFVPEFPNQRIPLLNLIFGSVFYMLLAPYTPANPLIVDSGIPISARVRAFGIGLVLSAAAWLVHAQILKRIEDSDLLARVAPGLSTFLENAKDRPAGFANPVPPPPAGSPVATPPPGGWPTVEPPKGP